MAQFDIIALLEYMDRQRKPQKMPRFHFNPNRKDVDIVSLIKKKKEEAELLEKFLKESGKKEDKKADKIRTLTNIEWFIVGIICHPIVGPLYNAVINNLQHIGR